MTRKALTIVVVLAASIMSYTVQAALKPERSTMPSSAVSIAPTHSLASAPFVGYGNSTQITLPSGWTNSRRANAPATTVISVANRSQGLSVVVTGQPKPAGVTFDQAVSISLVGQAAMKNVQIERTALTRINSYRAAQNKVQGRFSEAEVVMLVTVVETPTHYYFITAGGSKANFDQHRTELEGMVRSFREVAPAS